MLERLLSRADVFVQNLAPGAADRLGTSPARLRAASLAAHRVHRVGLRIVRAVREQEGLRPAGAERGRPACQSPAARTPPARVGISIADIAAGMYAYSGILTALLVAGHDRSAAPRSRSRCSTRSASGWASRPTTPRTAARHLRAAEPNHASIAPYGPFRAGDGDSVYLGIQNGREWTRFCAEVLVQPELAARSALQHEHDARAASCCAARDDRVDLRRLDRRPGDRATRIAPASRRRG